MPKKTMIHTTCGYATTPEWERQNEDYYATHPRALELFPELDLFEDVWEPAVGEGHLADVLHERRKLARASDLIDRDWQANDWDGTSLVDGHPNLKYRGTEVLDFLNCAEPPGSWDGDMITNPPYKDAHAWILKSLELLAPGRKLALFLPVRYLEGKQRARLFAEHPPRTVYVSASRLACAKNGDFTNPQNAVAYAWYVWEKGYQGETQLKWFN